MDYRLKSEKDFSLVFKKGKKAFCSKFTLIYIEKGNLKVGYAVGKKLGGSVTRNRIKRIFRESFRSFMPVLRQNFFFVFIPKISEDYNLAEIKKNMDYVFRKNNLYKDCIEK